MKGTMNQKKLSSTLRQKKSGDEMKVGTDNNIVDKFLFNLTLIFIFLKFFPGSPINDWSWWAILSPLWIPLLVLPIAFIISIVYSLVMAIDPKTGLSKSDFMIIKLTSYVLAIGVGIIIIRSWG